MTTGTSPGWHPVLLSKDLKQAPVALRRFGAGLVLWRARDGLACFEDRCPHRRTALSPGRVVDGALACPYHGFRFGPDGACTHLPVDPDAPIPAAMRLRGRVPVTEAHGLIWAWAGPAPDPLPAPPWFPGPVAGDRVAVDLVRQMPVHHLRLTESLFDLYHVAVLHWWTMLPGSGPVLIDASVETDERRVRFAGSLAAPGKAQGMPIATELMLPNLGRISIVGVQFLTVAATPIDEENTWVWLRYQQPWVTVPGLGHALSWVMGALDYEFVQRREDLPMFLTMPPGPPEPGQDVLVAADRGMAAFHRLRRQVERAGDLG